MMFADNPVLSRSMAIALLIAVVGGIWGGVAAPIIDHRRAQKAAIDQANRLIKGFEARRVDVTALKRRLAALRNDPSTVGAYFTAHNLTLAAARMQSRIKTVAEATGARLTTTQSLTAAGEKGGPERVAVRAAMVGSIEAILTVFHTLEASQPYIFLEEVSINTQTRRVGRRGKRQSGAFGLLSVRFTAYGYLWQGRKS